MKEWQKKAIDESLLLWERISALEVFVNNKEKTKDLDSVDIGLLRRQLEAMYMYNFILNLRISKFNPEYHEKSSID